MRRYAWGKVIMFRMSQGEMIGLRDIFVMAFE